MQTFDQALFDLYENGEIEYQEAIKHADSPNDLRLQIKLNSKKNKRSFTDNSESLSLNNS
jgi:twitching motility protein PilU